MCTIKRLLVDSASLSYFGLGACPVPIKDISLILFMPVGFRIRLVDERTGVQSRM